MSQLGEALDLSVRINRGDICIKLVVARRTLVCLLRERGTINCLDHAEAVKVRKMPFGGFSNFLLGFLTNAIVWWSILLRPSERS